MKFEYKIIFANAPKFSQLKYFQWAVDYTENENGDNISSFNWRKIKTRHLVRKYDYILAAPSDGWTSYIHFILTDAGFFKLKYLFGNEQIVFRPLSKDIYLKCILYTISVKLSPDWNQLNNYFVKGHHFLSSKEILESVKLQLISNDDDFILSIYALRLKIPKLNLINLDIDLKEFQKNGQATIKQKIHILPSLKAATAITVYLNLPKLCPFKNYSDIRNHWKTLYGYNLPENEDGMMYIEVIFDKSNFSYVYPIICVCPYEPLQFRSENEMEIINEFMDNLKTKSPTICGLPFKIHINENSIYRTACRTYLASEKIDKPDLTLFPIRDSSSKSHLQIGHNQNKQINHIPLNKNKAITNQSSVKRKLPEETFKCFPIFTPKKKASKSLIEDKKLKFTANIFGMNIQDPSVTPKSFSLKKF